VSYRDDANGVAREARWTFWRFLPIVLVVLVVLTGIGFALRSAGLIGEAYVDRKIFEQTQSYVHGKNTYIARLRMQYESADPNTSESLRRLILEEAETIDESNLTDSNREFIARLRVSR